MGKKGLVRFFDKLEDRIRGRLSHRPILYAFIGGIGVVLFWKGVWEFFEVPALYGLPSALLGLLLMLPTGLFVSFFIGDSIILSGYKHQKKLTEKTEEEILKDTDVTVAIKQQLDRMEKDMAELKTRHSQNM
jgi:hypothetical protein